MAKPVSKNMSTTPMTTNIAAIKRKVNTESMISLPQLDTFEGEDPICQIRNLHIYIVLPFPSTHVKTLDNSIGPSWKAEIQHSEDSTAKDSTAKDSTAKDGTAKDCPRR